MSQVEARHQAWYLKFVLHGTFTLEVGILAAATSYVWRRLLSTD